MSTGKEFPLSITVKAVDKATGPLRQIAGQVNRSFGGLRKMSADMGAGFAKVRSGLSGIGSVAKSLAGTVGIVGGAAGAAVFGFKKLVDEADDLGDAAEKVGLSVDALYQLRRAADEAGSSAEELDAGFSTFTKSLGQARAGTGRMASFLKKVSPELLKQVKAAKSNEEAFNLIAGAAAKIEDPAKRAALATAAFGGAGVALAPLLARGKEGVDQLRAAVLKHAGSQQAAADAAQKTKEAMGPLHDSIQSVKNSILVGLAPAFIKLAESASRFLTDHREEIAAWIRDFGEKLPDRIDRLGSVLAKVGEVFAGIARAIGWVVDKVGGAENAVKLLVAGFLAFKGLQLVGHLGSIAGGLMDIVGAAGKATSGMGALGAGINKLGAAIPVLAAVAAGAAAIAGVIDSDQDIQTNAKVRGGSLKDALANFRQKGDAESRRAVIRSLRDDGFIDKTTGAFKDTVANRQALGHVMDFNPANVMGGRQNVMDELAKIVQAGPISGPGITEPLKVVVEGKNLGPNISVGAEQSKGFDVELVRSGAMKLWSALR